jgi:hypothetical protein
MRSVGKAIVTECGTAYAAGRDWADALKAGDKFEGAAPEAAKRYDSATEQSMFIAGALTILDERALYIAMGEEGSTISRIEGHACREHERNSDKATEERGNTQ